MPSAPARPQHLRRHPSIQSRWELRWASPNTGDTCQGQLNVSRTAFFSGCNSFPCCDSLSTPFHNPISQSGYFQLHSTHLTLLPSSRNRAAPPNCAGFDQKQVQCNPNQLVCPKRPWQPQICAENWLNTALVERVTKHLYLSKPRNKATPGNTWSWNGSTHDSPQPPSSTKNLFFQA